MNAPKVTIAITCYNAAGTISRAINSALTQDWDNKEILVVDDASTDGSADVVKNIPGITLIRHATNQGVAAARNTLLQSASGEYLVFFDDDDASLPGRVRAQLQRLVDYQQETGITHAACYASGQRFYPNGYSIPLPAIGAKPVIPHGTGMADRLLFFRTIPGWSYGGTPACALMARVDTFKAAGSFDPCFRRVEDLDWAVRLALMGGHFIGCNETLYHQFSTAGGDKTAARNHEAEVQLIEKHADYLRGRGYYTYARRWVDLRYSYFAKDYVSLARTFGRLFLAAPFKTLSHILTTGPARLKRDFFLRNHAPKTGPLKIMVAGRAFHNMPGGVERMAVALMHAMLARGHDVSLLTWENRVDAETFFPLDPRIRWHKVVVGHTAVKATLKQRLQRMVETRRIIKKDRPNVVVAFQDGPFIALRLYLFDFRLKMILAERNAPTRFDHTSQGARRHWFFRAMALAHAITVQLPSYIGHYPEYLRHKITSIANPVFPATGVADVAGTPAGAKTLLCIGRLGYQKNQKVLVEAFARIASEFPLWHLRLVSEGDDRPVLEAMVRDLGLEHRITLPGATKDVGAEYMKSHLFCLPSRWEGFPNNLVEGFAYGVPAVGFADCAGINELIVPGKTGALALGMNSATTLAATLATIMRDDAGRARMGAAARESVAQYSPPIIFNQWEKLIRTVVNS